MTPPRPGRRLQGALFILVCALVWAVSVTWCKWRLSDETASLLLRPGHFTLAEVSGLAFVGILWCLISPRQVLKIPKGTFVLLGAIALFASVGALAVFYLGLELTQQINATLLGHTQVVFIALISLVCFGQKLSRSDIIGIVVLLAGAALITLRTRENLMSLNFDNFGDLLVLIAAIFWATGGVMSQRLMDRLTGPQILAWRGLLAALVVIGGRALYAATTSGDSTELDWLDKLCLSSELLTNPELHIYVWELMAYGTLVGCGFLCYYLGLERLTATEASMWELSTPLFAMVLAYLVNDEIPTAVQWGGTVLLLGGLGYLGRADEMPGHLQNPPE